MNRKTTFEKFGFEQYCNDIVALFNYCECKLDSDGNFVVVIMGDGFVFPKSLVKLYYRNYLTGRTTYDGALNRFIKYAERKVKEWNNS